MSAVGRCRQQAHSVVQGSSCTPLTSFSRMLAMSFSALLSSTAMPNAAAPLLSQPRRRSRQRQKETVWPPPVRDATGCGRGAGSSASTQSSPATATAMWDTEQR